MSNLGQTLLIPARGSDASAALNPSAVSGLKLWLKADAITGKTDGQAISSWLDSSGNGYDAGQVTGSRQPLYKTAILNGLPTVRFDGTDTLSTPSVAFGSPTGITVYVVISAASGTNGRIVEASADYNAVNTAFLVQRVSSAIFTGHRGDVGRFTFQGSDTIAAAGAAKIVSAVFDKTQTVSENKNWVGGHCNPGTVTEANNTITDTFGDNVLWIASQAQTGSFLTGDIAEIIVYAGAHSNATRLRIERYLQNKWGFSPYTANIVCDGDSLTYGTNASTGNNWPGQLMASLSSNVTLTNLAVSGARVDQMDADAATQIDGMKSTTVFPNICIVWGGTNDLFLSQSGTLTELSNYVAARKAAGWKTLICTILPRSDAGVPGGFEAARISLNASIVGGSTGADAIADLAADTRIGDAGDSNDLTYYAADKVHMTDTGYGIVAGIIKTALATLGVT